MMWSYILAIVSTLGLWLAGTRRTRHAGWGVCLAAQMLWITYALISNQLGFIIYALAHAAVYFRNFEHKERS